MYCKYVVMNFTEPMGLENETMFIFPDFVTHKGFVYSLKRHYVEDVVSAGFLLVNKDKDNEVNVTAYGKSTTLNVDSREDQDSRLAKYTLGLD